MAGIVRMARTDLRVGEPVFVHLHVGYVGGE